MNRKHLDRNLDEWLDQSLAEYGVAEPRPGIETRVLTGLQSRLDSRSGWRLRRHPAWIPAVVAVALIFVVVLFITPGKPPAPDPASGNDQELLRGVDRQLNKEVPAALEPAFVLTKEMAKQQ